MRLSLKNFFAIMLLVNAQLSNYQCGRLVVFNDNGANSMQKKDPLYQMELINLEENLVGM